MSPEIRPVHLTDDELFGLAVPPAGEPEALPAHVLECPDCGRALQDWKIAVRQVAREDVAPVLARTAGEWRERETATLEALRGVGKRRRFHPLPWAAGLAASLLAAAVLLTSHRAPQGARRPASLNAAVPTALPSSSASPSSPELTGEDAADDILLRDVARLSRGDDLAGWTRLAPEPGRTEEDPL